MIDKEKAIQWAKDAGFVSSIISLGYDLATPSSIQALITRAQNEAFEQAALLFNQPYMEYFGGNIQDEIRALKQESSK